MVMRKMAPVGRLKSRGDPGGGAFSEADREILVKMVKHAQWRGVSGTKGPWRKFLATVDRALPQIHDPSKRPWKVLASFIETWKDEKDIEIVKRAHEYIRYKKTAEVLEATEPWPDFPEEKLARLTKQHPQFSRDYNFPSYHEDWVRSELVTAKDLSSPAKLLALDCEMVTCEDGSLQVVRVCAVDRNLQTVIDTLVLPSKKVKEYKSHITGVTAEDLESVTVTQSDIQRQVKGRLSPGTILIGHSLHNDLRALHIDHRRVIDTAYIFPIRNRPRIWSPPLRDLCKLVLGYDFREDDKPHDCLEDAKVPMKLILHCVKAGLQPLTVPDEVDEAVLSKLLIHRVPKNIIYEELKLIFPRKIRFEFQFVNQEKQKAESAVSTIYSQFHHHFEEDLGLHASNTRLQETDKDPSNGSKYYSTYAVFASKEVANSAFNQLKGITSEDITGRLQKTVPIRSRFQHKRALRIAVVVRQMANSGTYLEEPADQRNHGLDKVDICSKVVETAEDLNVGPSVGTGEQLSGLKRSRTEEDVGNPSDIPAAKKLKEKKKKKSQIVSPVPTLGLEEEMENVDKDLNVGVNNFYHVLSRVSAGTGIDKSAQQTSVSGGRKKSSKKRKRSKGKK